MARNRANIEQGQRAWVGDLEFGPGQLLPPGTVEYQVTGWTALDPSEYFRSVNPATGKSGIVKGVPYSITVPVGTSKADVQEAAELVAELTLADAYANAWATDQQLGMDIFDLL